MDDHDTGFHDHDVSCGALAVAQGAIVEERLALGGPPLRRRMRAGQAVDFAASDIHRVVHGGGGPAVTINAYSPPLWRMGAYETTPTGELRRHSISYAEELRPLGLVATNAGGDARGPTSHQVRRVQVGEVARGPRVEAAGAAAAARGCAPSSRIRPRTARAASPSSAGCSESAAMTVSASSEHG